MARHLIARIRGLRGTLRNLDEKKKELVEEGRNKIGNLKWYRETLKNEVKDPWDAEWFEDRIKEFKSELKELNENISKIKEEQKKQEIVLEEAYKDAEKEGINMRPSPPQPMAESGTVKQVTIYSNPPAGWEHSPSAPRLVRDIASRQPNSIIQHIHEGDDPNVQFYGMTLLYYLVINGFEDPYIEIVGNAPGIDVNKRSTNGKETPLFGAVREGRIPTLKALLKLPGIDFNKPNKYGVTPLKNALDFGKTDVANLIQEAIANEVWTKTFPVGARRGKTKKSRHRRTKTQRRVKKRD